MRSSTCDSWRGQRRADAPELRTGIGRCRATGRDGPIARRSRIACIGNAHPAVRGAAGHGAPRPYTPRVIADFAAYAAVLLDLDGTLYHEDHVLPGAVALVERLRREGRTLACLTNSTTSPARLGARLAGMGIDVPESGIYTAAAAAADYVAHHYGPRPRVFNLATEGLEEMLDGRCTWVSGAGEACDAVIVGAPANVYATAERQRAALYLLRAGATLVGVCADRVYPSPRGLEFGSGALVEMLAYAANVPGMVCISPCDG